MPDVDHHLNLNMDDVRMHGVENLVVGERHHCAGHFEQCCRSTFKPFAPGGLRVRRVLFPILRQDALAQFDNRYLIADRHAQETLRIRQIRRESDFLMNERLKQCTGRMLDQRKVGGWQSGERTGIAANSC
ncbi:hypothetical protein [Caballeronia hypogeia]|uniref:hypothetical protein n=1 Tax=Caballeronia hypogeia TaxID=1777140 RepID=UPI0012FE30F4|nr:hypothetical protein [Caballeronia hypogeia]